MNADWVLNSKVCFLDNTILTLILFYLFSFTIFGLMKKRNGECFLGNLAINMDICIEYKVPFGIWGQNDQFINAWVKFLGK